MIHNVQAMAHCVTCVGVTVVNRVTMMMWLCEVASLSHTITWGVKLYFRFTAQHFTVLSFSLWFLFLVPISTITPCSQVQWMRKRSLLNPNKVLDERHSLSFPGKRTHAIVPGLEPFSEYRLTVNVFNKKGNGPNSDPVTFTTPEGGEVTQTTNIQCTAYTPIRHT